VVVRRVLKQLADVEIGLKWPNDLVFDGRKLGGILVEFTAEAQGACHVVAGIGLNVAIPKRELDAISDWPGGAIDLDSITTTSPGRCRLAAGLIAGCGTMFEDFEAKGFAPYKAEWHTAHVLTDRDVRVTGALATTGRVVGISEDGALLLATESGQSRIVAGDVSLRLS
jgi:BirA family biotin operon repressor/biotin-[acetyl-CoA-carboxylase] ligase